MKKNLRTNSNSLERKKKSLFGIWDVDDIVVCGLLALFFLLPPESTEKIKIQIIYRKRARREKRKNNKNSIWDKRAREETRDFHNYGQLLFLIFLCVSTIVSPRSLFGSEWKFAKLAFQHPGSIKSLLHFSSDSSGRSVLLLFVWCHRIDERLDSILYSNRRLQLDILALQYRSCSNLQKPQTNKTDQNSCTH